jgi:hypothetical protein
LAFGGYTDDSSLTGYFSMLPFITLASIAINEYYWSKAFFDINDHGIVGLQFSTDGEFIIAHTYHAFNPSIILVIDVDSGKVISARSY